MQVNIEDVGLERGSYWRVFQLTDEQFYKIARMGQVGKIINNSKRMF